MKRRGEMLLKFFLNPLWIILGSSRFITEINVLQNQCLWRRVHLWLYFRQRPGIPFIISTEEMDVNSSLDKTRLSRDQTERLRKRHEGAKRFHGLHCRENEEVARGQTTSRGTEFVSKEEEEKRRWSRRTSKSLEDDLRWDILTWLPRNHHRQGKESQEKRKKTWHYISRTLSRSLDKECDRDGIVTSSKVT